jgi:BlaI family transcriptional regulator, penicillinase repressor
MARTPRDITDAELAVLQALWVHGAQPIRRIAELLYVGARPSQYATVQKLLERLEGKGCVERDRSSSIHVFVAAIDREELVGRRLQDVAEKLCGGSWTPLLTHLVQAEKLSASDLEALRQLIDAQRRPEPRKRRGKEAP